MFLVSFVQAAGLGVVLGPADFFVPADFYVAVVIVRVGSRRLMQWSSFSAILYLMVHLDVVWLFDLNVLFDLLVNICWRADQVQDRELRATINANRFFRRQPAGNMHDGGRQVDSARN